MTQPQRLINILLLVLAVVTAFVQALGGALAAGEPLGFMALAAAAIAGLNIFVDAARQQVNAINTYLALVGVIALVVLQVLVDAGGPPFDQATWTAVVIAAVQIVIQYFTTGQLPSLTGRYDDERSRLGRALLGDPIR